jgi:hypothetical protein
MRDFVVRGIINRCYAERLDQVLGNPITTRQDGPEGREFPLFAKRAEGSNIPPEISPPIFEHPYRIDSSGNGNEPAWS